MMTAYMAALRCSQHAYEALSSRDDWHIQLSSVLYSIVSGHWPHRDCGPFLAEDYRIYNELVEGRFRNRE